MNALREFNQHLCFTEVALYGFDIRSVLVIGTERAVVWDTLTHPSDMKSVLPLLKNKELIIVYSHAEWSNW